MMWSNPNMKNKKENKMKINNEEKIVTNDKIISLNEILEPTIKQENYLEYIDSPLSANITDVPKSINFSLNELGKLNIKYENYLNSLNKMI